MIMAADDVDKYYKDALTLELTLAQKLDTIAKAQQGQSGTPNPTTTDFSVTSVSVHSKSDETSPVIRKAKAGKKIFVFVEWSLRSSPADAKPSYAFSATQGGRVVAQSSFQGSLASYPPDDYVVGWQTNKLKKRGTYVITGRVTLGGQSHESTTTFKVVK
jgi:hypothetical protein